jgi:hypothetical protein
MSTTCHQYLVRFLFFPSLSLFYLTLRYLGLAHARRATRSCVRCSDVALPPLFPQPPSVVRPTSSTQPRTSTTGLGRSSGTHRRHCK